MPVADCINLGPFRSRYVTDSIRAPYSFEITYAATPHPLVSEQSFPQLHHGKLVGVFGL